MRKFLIEAEIPSGPAYARVRMDERDTAMGRLRAVGGDALDKLQQQLGSMPDITGPHFAWP